MASFSFLHAADIHLDSPLTGLSRYDGVPADAIRAAPRAAFDRLIGTAIERQVDFVVIAGDLYDGDWRDMGTGLYFAAAMGRLGRAGIPVYLLAGNHDAASVITRALPKLERVHTFSTRRAETHHIPHLDVAIHGHSFADRAVGENLAARYPDPHPGAFNIGLLHTSLGGHAAHETYAPCTPQELAARGYDYWALGHVHEHLIVSAAPHIVFPGNVQGRSIREDGPRGAVLVDVQDGQVSDVQRLVLDVVRWARVSTDAGPASDLDALHGTIRASLRHAYDTLSDDRPLIVRLTIEGHTALHGALQDVATRLRDDVRGIAAEVSPELWIEKIRVRTQPAALARAASDPDEFAQLLETPDPTLAARLADEFARFLAGVQGGEADGLVRQAASGDWAGVMDLAADALRHRLANAG